MPGAEGGEDLIGTETGAGGETHFFRAAGQLSTTTCDADR